MGDSFDVSFKLFPPDLQAKLWVLGLDANTSKVSIAYRPGNFVTSLAYNYGGNVEAALGIRAFSTRLSVNPSSGNLDLGLVYRGFSFGTSANFTQKSTGVNLSYGAQLLPFPSELESIFNSGAIGLQSMARDIGAAPNNPLAWYKLHSDDAAAVSRAIRTGRKIAEQGKSSYSFGASLRLDYTQQTGLTIYGAVGLTL